MSLLAELKRRNVIRVGAAYLVSAWVLIEIADILFPALGFPRFALQLLIVGLALSVALMGLAATFIARLLQKYRWIAYIGLAIILYVALEMIWRGVVEIWPQVV